MNMLTNLLKAGVAVAISPAALVADLAKLPANAYDNRPLFRHTGSVLGTAGECAKEAIKPERE